MYGVFRSGGSIGEITNKVVKTFETKELAQQYSRRMNRLLTPGEKTYYRIRYSVRVIQD